MMWAGASVLFVYVWMIFHMQSLILATYCILIIVCSFPATQVLYKSVFMIDFYNTLHTLVIFIVLGISADDVFVLYDAWKQSEHIVEYEGNLRKRMAYAWRRAAHAMFITSSTTCLAFLSTSLS